MKNYIFMFSLLLNCVGSYATVLFVESLDDAIGTVATLRQTILDASSTDIIRFNVSGVILLNEELGELVIDKQLIIDGDSKIIIDGQDQINVCFHITNSGTTDASLSVIQNIFIQNFNGHEVDPGIGTELNELPAYGILIDNGAEACSVFNVSIKNINSGYEEEVAGIKSDEDMIGISGNVIKDITSESNILGDSGNAYGIFMSALLLGDCSDNSVANIASGDASGETGLVNGITVLGLSGNCVNNTVSDLVAGLGAVLDASFGILIGLVSSGSASGSTVLSCNTVSNMIINGPFGAGMFIGSGDDLVIQSNIIDAVENTDGYANGLLLGLAGSVTNSLISFNSISNIVGSNNNGFGISIEGTGSSGISMGNDLLNNSIFNINGRAISTLSNGVPVDATVTLTSVRCADGCKLIVEGVLNLMIDAPQFKLQFFVSDSNTPSQSQIFIAERVIDTPQDSTFKLRLTGLPPVAYGQYVTATATAIPDGLVENNNTSEVSNALPACEPTGNFCPCTEVVLPEPPTCPII